MRAFTYIEVLIALSILGFILSLHTVLGSEVILRNEVRTERDTFVTTLLITARTRALTNEGESSHGVHIDTTKKTYVLFKGSTYEETNVTNEVIPFQNNDVSIENSEGFHTIIFEALTGDVDHGAGTYALSLGSHVLTVNLNTLGRIDW
jgi:Tfp pilus assembly protein FimT